MHIGLFLVRKGVVTADQFVVALETQIQRIVPLGQLAVEEGMLSRLQLLELLRVQSSDPDARFGDVAVERGYLTKYDVHTLLSMQSDKRVPTSEIFVELGILTRQQADAEIAAFRRKQERSSGQTAREKNAAEVRSASVPGKARG